MLKKFTYLLYFLATVIIIASTPRNLNAQCSTTSWTLTPPPVNGAYEAGQTVHVCLTVTYYQMSGANWLHGIELNFPPGWDQSSVTNTSAPDACSWSNGNWLWMESVTGTGAGSGQSYGPGFFYDASSGGPQDGNPGNNYGDNCTNFPPDFTFCFDITLDSLCGGGGSPLDGSDILPVIFLLGDGESGSWTGTTACESAPTSPDIPGGLTLNCCDAESGVPPAQPLNICGTTPFDLLDTLGGPVDTPGEWSGPAGWSGNGNTTSAIFDPNIDGPGSYSYSVEGSDGCINTSTIVIENIDLGQQSTTGYCDSAPVNIFDLWTNPNFMPPQIGTWTDPTGIPLVNHILDPAIHTSGLFLYEYDDANGCYTTLTFNIVISPGAADPLNSCTIDVCTLDPCFSLMDSLLSCNITGPVPGGQWIYSDSNDNFLNLYSYSDVIVCPDDYNGADSIMVDGYFTYYSINPPCPLTMDTVFINVYEPFDPGQYTVASICDSDAPLDFLDFLNLLEGTPEDSGTWYDLDNLGQPEVSFPFDPSSLPPDQTYNFLYEGGLGGTQCQSSTLLELTILSNQTDAGDPNSVTVCETVTSFNMLDSLLGTPQPGGVWTNSAGDTLVGGFYIPSLHSSGIYTYTLDSPCGSDSSTLTVTELAVPDAGISGILEICSNETDVPLSSGLGGTPAFGGTWQLGGSDVGDTVDGDSVNDGDIYTYTVGPAGCQALSQVEIDLTEAPDAGTFIAGPHEYCETDGSIPLFSLFDDPPNVIQPTYWSGPGGFTGNTLNLATAVSGTYTYMIPDNGCGSDSESLIISIESTPNAGSSSTAMLCPSASGSISLDSILSYPAPLSPGTWTSVPSGGPTTGVFVPGVDPEGSYTYTATSLPNGLCSATATVNVGYISLPDAGTDTTITVCESDGPFQLFTGGNPASGGNWSPGTGMFIPGTTSPGTFTYEFPGGACPNPSAQITVIVDTAVNAGNNSSAQVCVSAGIIDLPSYLSGGADSGGTWNNLTTGESDIPDQYDVTNSAGESIVFEYELTNGACSDAATLNVNVHEKPDAGPDVTATLCGTGGPYSLTNILDPTAEPGDFYNPSHVLITNGIITLNTANSGAYTYEVSSPYCPTDVANYTINIQAPLAVSNLTTSCNAAQTDYTVSFEITGGDGNYTVTGLSGTLNSSVSPAVFTSDELPSGSTYSYTVSDGGPCADISVNNQPGPICDCPASAAWVGGNVSICEGESVDLELNLSGTGPFHIDYTDGANPIVDAGPYNNGDVITVSPTQNTTYTITQVADANCFTGVNSSITVNVEALPDAGPNVTASFCAGGTLNLNTLIDPNADVPGTFTGPVTVTNNTVPQTPASSGVYTYTVPGTQCPDDQASYNITIYPPLSVSAAEVLCNQSQTAYTVSFEITGGDGNYTIAGGSISGSNPAVFTSNEIPNGSDYSFTVSDGSPCSDAVVAGVDPQCDCPATADISGTTAICLGECTDLIFTLQGDGPFTVVYENSNNPANPITLTGINDQHVVTVCPNTTTTYTVLSVNDANCAGFDTGTPVTVTVDQPINVTGITETCDLNNENYTVTFTINGGDPSAYVVTSNVSGIGNGSVTSGEFTSPPIPSGMAYDFTVTDNGACDVVDVTGSFTCACTSDAGSIQPGLIEVCSNQDATVVHNGDEVLDGNDSFQFLLHDGDENTIGTVLGTSLTGSFSYINGLEYGTTYYITAVAGNNNGMGGVDLSHICTDQSNGVPVIFNALPTANISGGATVCEGVPVDLTIAFTGEAPFSFNYALNGTDQGNTVSTGTTYTLTTTAPGNYTVTSVSDNNCSGTASGQAVVGNFETPTATLGGNPNVCEGSGDGPELTLTGDAPWTVVYTFNGVAQDPITTSFSGYVIPADEDGFYEVVSVNDQNCPGTTSGSLQVTIIDAPTATLTGGGTVCDGDEAPFTVHVTGDGPWSVKYAVDGVPQPPLNIGESSFYYTFDSDLGGNYTLTAVNDQNCPGQTMTSQASLVVNPIPSADILSNQDEICIGEQLDLTFDLQGNAPFDFTYVINGDTVTVTGIGTNYFQTLYPTEPVNITVISISDASNPTCTGTSQNSRFIPVGELPDAPVLWNDTICVDDGSVQIGVTPVAGLSYSWYPTSRLSDPNVANPVFHATGFFPDVKNFQYILTADNGNCSAQDTMILTVDPGPRARFDYSPRPVRSEDTKVHFQNLTSGNGDLMYFWEFDSLSTSQAFDPTYKFPTGVVANYNVTLTVIDPSTGCQGEFTDKVVIRPEMLVYIPNAFTPNNDGLNDLWGPVMTNIDDKDYRLTIYDRLGEVVFFTKDPNKKWNGSMRGGDHFVQAGVYIWVIETKNPITLDDYDFKGKVTVVR